MKCLRGFGLIGALFCAAISASPAGAQSIEVPNTPRLATHGTTVGLWAEETTFGTCIVVAIKQGETWVLPRGPLGCKSNDARSEEHTSELQSH